MRFDFGGCEILVRDDDDWRDMLGTMASELFDEAGKDEEEFEDEFFDFKYDVLDDVVRDVIQDALNNAISDRRLCLDSFKDFFDELEEF